MGEAKRKTARGPVPTLEQYLRALGSDRAEERDAFADLADFVSRTLEAYEQTDENRQIAQMQRCMKIAALAMVEGCNDEVRHGHAPATAAVAMCRAFGMATAYALISLEWKDDTPLRSFSRMMGEEFIHGFKFAVDQSQHDEPDEAAA